MTENTQLNTLYLCFGTGAGFFAKFLKRGFSHVLMVKKEGEVWVVVDPKLSMLSISARSSTINIANILRRKFGFTVVKVTYIEQHKRFVPFIAWGVTCVNICKYIMNYKCKCITAYSLYKHLIKCKDNEDFSFFKSIEILE